MQWRVTYYRPGGEVFASQVFTAESGPDAVTLAKRAFLPGRWPKQRAKIYRSRVDRWYWIVEEITYEPYGGR